MRRSNCSNCYKLDAWITLNWYKISSLIDSVTVVQATGNSIVIIINGRRYEYSGIPGTYYDNEIRRWKMSKNKRKSGENISALIKNLNPYRVEPKPTQKTDEQGTLFN